MHQAVAILRKAYGNSHPRVASQLANTAVIMWQLEDFDGAVPLLQEASDILGGHTGMLGDIEKIKRHEPCTM